MDSAKALYTYVQDQLQFGLNHQQITNQLLASGWSIEQLKEYAPYLFTQQVVIDQQPQQTQAPLSMAAPQVIQPSVIAPYGTSNLVLPNTNASMLPQVAEQSNESIFQLNSKAGNARLPGRRNVIMLVVATMIIVAVLSGAYVLFRSESTAKTNFNDPNFSMQVPDGWQTDRGYEPGKTLVLLYSPENEEEATRDKTAQFTAYIGIGYDRAEEQITYLKDANVQYQLIRDEKFSENDTEYRLIEYTFQQLNSDKKSHTLMVNAKRGDFLINADVVSSDEHWQLHAEKAEALLRSVSPACNNIYGKNEVFKDIAQLCS